MNNKELSRLEEKLKYDDLSHDDCVLLIQEIKALKHIVQSYEQILESEQEGKYSQGIFVFNPATDGDSVLVASSIGNNIEKITINKETLWLHSDYTITRFENNNQMLIDFSNYLNNNKLFIDETDNDIIYIYYSIRR
jgi:hypothetical protein